jgi:ferritin-like metal-binding protein YciE
MKSLHDLFVDQLKDIYNAENQLVKALPKVAKTATNPQLKRAVEEHLQQTRGHVERLERVFQEIDTKARGKTCVAMEGLIEEAKELMAEKPEAAVLDAGLIAGAQKVEHYEIASYGTLRTWARQLGLSHSGRLLGQTLQEEKEADRKLTEIGEGAVNLEAQHV